MDSPLTGTRATGREIWLEVVPVTASLLRAWGLRGRGWRHGRLGRRALAFHAHARDLALAVVRALVSLVVGSRLRPTVTRDESVPQGPALGLHKGDSERQQWG